MAFRKSIPQAELREKLQQRGQDNRHNTVYQPSRGGHYPPKRDTHDKR